MNPTQKFIVAGLCLAFGLFFILLGAILNKTYFGFMVLIPMILTVVPTIMVPPGAGDGDGSFFESLANFLIGLFLASVPCLLFVLKHINAINTQDLLLTTTGVIFLVTAVVFVSLGMRRNDGFSSF